MRQNKVLPDAVPSATGSSALSLSSGKDLHKIFITVYPQPASKTYPKSYISALHVRGMMLHFDIVIFWFTRKENSEILINFRSAPSLRWKATMPAFADKF